MDDKPDHPPNPALNALMAVVEELYAAGLFDEHNLSNIAGRLDLAEHGDIADRIRVLPVSATIWAELSGGGNSEAAAE